MDIARLNVIYSLLLAHCLSLDPQAVASATKRFGAIHGREIAPPVDADDIAAALRDGIADLLSTCAACGHSQHAHLVNENVEAVNPGQNKVNTECEMLNCRCREYQPHGSGDWQCLKHQWFDCLICRHDILLPIISDQELARYETEAMRNLAAHFPTRPIKICTVPSEIGMLLAAAWLARYFDLNGVPGFYRAPLREPLPGAPADKEVLYWMRERISTGSGSDRVNWMINFPDRLMRSPTRPGLLVPYDNCTGQILGLRVYRSVRDQRPTLLTSRDLPGGSRAVAIAE